MVARRRDGRLLARVRSQAVRVPQAGERAVSARHTAVASLHMLTALLPPAEREKVMAIFAKGEWKPRAEAPPRLGPPSSEPWPRDEAHDPEGLALAEYSLARRIGRSELRGVGVEVERAQAADRPPGHRNPLTLSKVQALLTQVTSNLKTGVGQLGCPF